jgi:hypothetical protein
MKQLCLVVLLVVLFASPASVRADAAPPYYPPGSNPQPGVDITQVRMVAETVVIEVRPDNILPTQGSQDNVGHAHVTADFSMRNLGTAVESMAARFPISAQSGYGKYPEISNFEIRVDGKQISYRRAMYPDVSRPGRNEEEVPWAEFDVTFPVGVDVALHVEYDLQSSGYYPTSTFYYILETGAGWKDTIGSAEIILRLPYEANPQNVLLDIGTGWAETTAGGAFQGNEVRWHYEDFEPGKDKPVRNMAFVLVSPIAWQKVLAARANVEKYPNDGETWGMFAKEHKAIYLGLKWNRTDAGGEELWKLSVAGYEKCLSLKPNDAQWHAGFADLLVERAFWDSWIDGEWSDPTPEAFRALDEIHTALALAPNDPVVLEIAREIAGLMPDEGMVQIGDRYELGWLTQTPTTRPPTPTDPTPTNLPTFTPVSPTPEDLVSALQATPTALPTATTQAAPAHASPTPVPQRSSPLCGSAAFLPLAAAFWFVWKKKT